MRRNSKGVMVNVDAVRGTYGRIGYRLNEDMYDSLSIESDKMIAAADDAMMIEQLVRANARFY